MNVVLLALALASGVDDALHPQPIRVEVVIYKGDPLGSRADGTVQILAESNVVTASRRPADVRVGGGDRLARPFGPLGFQAGPPEITIGVVPEVDRWGRVLIDVQAARLEDLPGGQGFREQKTTLARGVASGEKFRFRITADSPDSQTWAEVTATVLPRGK